MDAVFGLLNFASKTILEIDPDSARRLSALEGKTMRVQLSYPELALYFIPSAQGLEIQANTSKEPDVTLTGPVLAFARLATGGMDSGVMADGQVTMEGDAETGQQFQKILAGMDLDWEELIARVIGDTPARKTGNLLRGIGNWVSESIVLSKKNTAEYFQEEKQILPTSLAMERFETAVDSLRSDLDRLEQRVIRLRRNID